MHILIVGAGTVGFSLAEILSTHGHVISVVESDPSLCDNINSSLDVFTINGTGSSPLSLQKAGIHKADIIIAVTPSDELNLLVCAFAKQYKVERRIARIVSGEYVDPQSGIHLDEIGVTNVIEPEQEIVKNILQYIQLPGVTETANFQSDNVYLRGYIIHEKMPIAHKTLSEINEIANSSPMLIVAIIRKGESVVPHGNQVLLPGDEIITIMPKDSFSTFLTMLGKTNNKTRKVVISGDTITAIHLANALKKRVERVLLVDPVEAHAKKAASELDDVEVIHGDCTKSEILQEIRIKNTSFFIAAGKDTEDNVMSGLLAKAEGAGEVIAVNNSARHANLFQSLGLDHIINPSKTTAQKILGSILRLPIKSYLGLDTVNIEVLRMIAEKNSKIVRKPLRDLTGLVKKSVTIGAIMRGDEVIIPFGETTIQPDDEVIILCPKKESTYVNRLFKSGPTIPV